MFGHSRGLDRRGRTSRSRKYKSIQDSCNWRTRALSAQSFREDKRVTQKALCRILHSAVSPAGLGRGQRGAVVSAGMYLVRLHYPGGEQTQRLLYLK